MKSEKQPEETVKTPAKKVRFGKKRISVLILLVVVLGITLFMFKKTNDNTSMGISTEEVITFSTDSPSEEKPNDSFAWRGKPEHPKMMSIPSVGIDNYIQAVGVDQNKEVAVPNNIHLAGWFADSVLPGQKGMSIIDGHVDGRTQDGVFKTLPEVKKDAEVILTYGDNSTKKFRVVEITEVPEANAADVLFSQNLSISNQLNLITCVGKFDQTTKRYDKRVIVSTELIQ